MGMYTPPNEDVHSPHGDVQNPNEDVQSRKHDVFRFGTQNGRFWCHEIVIERGEIKQTRAKRRFTKPSISGS